MSNHEKQDNLDSAGTRACSKKPIQYISEGPVKAYYKSNPNPVAAMKLNDRIGIPSKTTMIIVNSQLSFKRHIKKLSLEASSNLNWGRDQQPSL